jgi:hypothetical protein
MGSSCGSTSCGRVRSQILAERLPDEDGSQERDMPRLSKRGTAFLSAVEHAANREHFSKVHR